MAVYEKTISAKQFTGIIQNGDGVNLGLGYAMEAVNCDTTGGLLRPMRDGKELPGETAAPIGTLMHLYRRFHAADSESDMMIAAANDSLYYRVISQAIWTKVEGVTLQSDDMSYVTYEAVRKYAFTLENALTEGDYVKFDPDYSTVTVYTGGVETVVESTPTVESKNKPIDLANEDGIFKYTVGADGLEAGDYYVASPDPVDVLLMTNQQDGMLCFFGDTFKVEPVETPFKFGVITRHYERIWGGNCAGSPDTLVYSAPYNPFDWEQNTDIPEDGAGEISQPSWDGDSFIALVTYGSYILAIKRNKVWRILGTNPGEYIMKEQYGGGTAIRDSVAVNGDYVLMMGDRGLNVYDGNSVSDFHSAYLTDIFKDSNGLDACPYRVNMAHIGNACAIMNGKTYCLALTMGSSTVNNAVLEYNVEERAFSLRYGVYVKAFLNINGKVYYTSSNHPCSVYEANKGEPLPMHWVSGWQDLDALNVSKSSFNVYVQPVTDAPTTLKLSIETERKVKTKAYELSTERSGRAKNIRFGNSGRRFRFIIACDDYGVNWALTGGLQITMDLDED